MIRFLILVFMLQVSSQSFSGDLEYISGDILDKNGNLTKISDIRADSYVAGEYKGKKIKINFSKLKRIDVISDRSVRVKNKQDSEFILEKARINTPNNGCSGLCSTIIYRYFDPINMDKSSVKIRTSEITQLTLSSNIGRLRFNEKSKVYYPSDYLFDPFTGEELMWKSPEY